VHFTLFGSKDNDVSFLSKCYFLTKNVLFLRSFEQEFSRSPSGLSPIPGNDIPGVGDVSKSVYGLEANSLMGPK
jgi:hypothetical protein